MEKSFEPGQIESKWYARWEAQGLFKPAADGTPYCILLPPPNVTGTLHMGHAFQQTIMDALTRYHRMRGFRTLWQGGTDHAGIATQKIVENQLGALGQSRHDVGRDAFVERVWEWKQQSGSTITNQMRRIGASVDWSRERFTMDEGLSAAVRRVFVTWYRDGLIYRGKRLVHWDPVLMTAVSDLEVNSEEKDGSLWSIRYNVVDPHPGEPDHIVVATTRPETMLGDVAVAVHPDDERYAALVKNKRQLMLPLAGRAIPMIADDYVDRAFGTGAVKITPAHDFNDWQIGARHKLEPIVILTLDAKIRSHADIYDPTTGKTKTSVDVGIPPRYHGLDRFAARKALLADLETAGLLVETKKHKLQVPISQRTDAVIEPMLTDQWFLDLTSDTLPDGRTGGKKAITEPALAAVRDGAIKFVPEHWSTTYNQWLENIQDWCVSRQLWWGHQIPAWYDNHGKYYVAESAYEAHIEWFARVGNPDVPKKAGLAVGDSNETINQKLLTFGWREHLTQDEDVLDTWFSSALWPFSTMGWPGETEQRATEWEQFRAFVPSNVLVTGFDIIFFWVARMVMATQYFTGKVPFREVYINAIVRDAEGQKMSKSKGNTIDPLDVIDGISLEALVKKSTAALLIPQVRDKVEKRLRKDYPDGIAPVGADALRFTFAALATYGRTINFDLKRAEGYRNFCNKLWNAARFVLINCEERGFGIRDSRFDKTPATEAERWILTRLHHTLAEVKTHFASYRFDLLAQALYEFVWNEYCDWFLELAKPALNGDDKAAADSTRHTLLVVLEAVLRALHPITPFVTEEIWHEVAPALVRSSLSAKDIPAPTPDSSEPVRSSLSAKSTPASMPDSSMKSIAQCTYPQADEFAVDATAEAEIEWLKAVLSQIRRIRSEMSISPGKTIPLLFANGNANDRARIAKFASPIAFLARSESQHWTEPGEVEPAAAAAIVGDLRLLIPLAGLIDLDAEKARLEKEIKHTAAEIAKCNGKLGTATFVTNAPAAVVEQEKQRLADFSSFLAALREQLARLINL